MSADLIDAAVKAGAKGLVIAGVGDGNMTGPRWNALTAAAKSGVVVVRSTRLPSGIVYRNNEVNDDKLGLVASGELNPAKSRVLLQLALTKTRTSRESSRCSTNIDVGTGAHGHVESNKCQTNGPSKIPAIDCKGASFSAGSNSDCTPL